MNVRSRGQPILFFSFFNYLFVTKSNLLTLLLQIGNRKLWSLPVRRGLGCFFLTSPLQSDLSWRQQSRLAPYVALSVSTGSEMKPANATGSVSLAFGLCKPSFEPIMIVHFWSLLGDNSLHSDQVLDQGPFSVSCSSGNASDTLVLNNCFFEHTVQWHTLSHLLLVSFKAIVLGLVLQ